MEEYDQIEKYIKAELSEAEKIAFEKRLAFDSSLAEKLAAYRKDEILIKAAAREKLRKNAQDAYDNNERTKHNRPIIYQRLSVAASILILIIGGFWYFNRSIPISSEELFTQYFEMPSAPSVRNGNLDSLQLWAVSLSNYRSGNYENAIESLRELMTDSSFIQIESAKLLLGASHLSIGDNERAIEVFRSINPNSSLKQDADWYSSLALLKSGKIEEAKKLFTDLTNQAKFFKKKEAQEILDSLE